MRINAYFVLFMDLLLVACGGGNSEKSDALEIQAELRRIGVKSFVEKIDPNLSVAGTKDHYVNFREMPLLSNNIKNEIAGCYVIGDKLSPSGILFESFKAGDYYICVDGGGVPEFFGGYKKLKIIDNVYKIYR
jgi:hypothetical protein